MTGNGDAALYWRGSVSDLATDVRALLQPEQLRDLAALLHELSVLRVPMLLWCPQCCERHIDEGDFAHKPHHTHACQICGHVWRPAIVCTTGVQFLPGFKNEIKNEASP